MSEVRVPSHLALHELLDLDLLLLLDALELGLPLAADLLEHAVLLDPLGLDGDDALAVLHRDLDLAVRDRHRMTQLVYQRPLAGRLSGFVAAAHHRNWSHRRGLSNDLVMLGLSLRY